ncbi:hypothetical protein [Salipiger sp. PrR002]|uniref:hypothetical protein n=1 Tax=Salipiger sp. PrR002 TaxID=2706489 RepID=UPI0013B5EF27|nr:hypothetical protein [Salipiger sp. PrR002]NDV99086.1 hypothetical protein [Salipiger sp. PrR002]NDW56039.1 hypothetical protein [Salipiger sp. PrR004]
MIRFAKHPASLAALFALALSACLPQEKQSPAQEGAGAEDTAAAIPQDMQGRWGLVPADCTSTRGDAKGLMTVEGDTLSFYESRAVLDAVAESDPERLEASFAFTGEGLSWSRDVVLVLRGDTLVRQESGEGASPEPLTYTRCG